MSELKRDRVCPACQNLFHFSEFKKIKISRKKPPVTILVCCSCFDTTANVLAMIQKYYPEQITFEKL